MIGELIDDLSRNVEPRVAVLEGTSNRLRNEANGRLDSQYYMSKGQQFYV